MSESRWRGESALKVRVYNKRGKAGAFAFPATAGQSVLDARKSMDKVFGKAQPTVWKKSKINVLWDDQGYQLCDSHALMDVVAAGADIYASEMLVCPKSDDESEAGSTGAAAGKAPAKPRRSRGPSEYNTYVKQELGVYKAKHPEATHGEAFAAVAASWSSSEKNPKRKLPPPPGADAQQQPQKPQQGSTTMPAEAPPVDPPKKKKKKDKKSKKEKGEGGRSF